MLMLMLLLMMMNITYESQDSAAAICLLSVIAHYSLAVNYTVRFRFDV